MSDTGSCLGARPHSISRWHPDTEIQSSKRYLGSQVFLTTLSMRQENSSWVYLWDVSKV